MTPTEQDKELRQLVYMIQNADTTYDAMQFITADRKRVELEGRIDCLKRLPAVTTNFMNGAVSLVVLKKEIDRRIAELKAQQEEVK